MSRHWELEIERLQQAVLKVQTDIEGLEKQKSTLQAQSADTHRIDARLDEARLALKVATAAREKVRKAHDEAVNEEARRRSVKRR